MKHIKTFEKYNNLDLIEYVNNNNIEDVKDVLNNANIDIDIQDTRGNTALIWAAYHSDFEIIKLLIEAGADFYIKNDLKLDFFDYLKYNQKKAIIKLYSETEQYKNYLNKKNEEKYNL